MPELDLPGIVTELATLAGQLRAESGSPEVLERALKTVVGQIPGCEHASISDDRAVTIAASDDAAREADALQHRTGEGPCLQAALDGDEFYTFSVESETRWPAYTAALLRQSPIRSSLALPLRTEHAALNLFADRADAFDHDSLAAAAVVATVISALLTVQRSEDRAMHLERALENSRLIGTAVGVVMASHKVTRDTAFETLKGASQHLNRKLRDVADRIVETGVVPEVPARRAPGPDADSTPVR